MTSLSPAREPGNGTGHILPTSNVLVDAGSSPVGGHKIDPDLRQEARLQSGNEGSSPSGASIQSESPFNL